jgi:hypothetical protein
MMVPVVLLPFLQPGMGSFQRPVTGSSLLGGEVGSVVSVGFDAGGGPIGSDVADSDAGDGITLVAGDEVGPSTPSIASEGSTFAPPDLSVSSDQARWVAETASPECLCSSDTSEEGESSGSAENDLVGDVSESKSFADSAREDSQAWFFGWVRASVDEDSRQIVIEERTRRTKLDPLPVEHPFKCGKSLRLWMLRGGKLWLLLGSWLRSVCEDFF